MASNFAQQRALHVAIVPAGSDVWATAQGLPCAAGHRAGVAAVRHALDVAPGLGIGTLTLHAFSCDGWQLPDAEMSSILACIGELLASETAACLRNGVRVSVIGRRNRLPGDLLATIARSEAATAGGRCLHLRLAIDCSTCDAIFTASASAPQDRTPESDVDLLVLTGGDQRHEDFLLWECAHAELLFVPKPWPEFGPDDLADAVVEFHRRKRRAGELPCVPAPGARP